MKLLIVAYNPDYVSQEALAQFIEGLNKQDISVQTVQHVKKEAAPIYSVQFIAMKDQNQTQINVPPHFGKPLR